MELFFVFGRFVQQVIVSYFSEPLVQKTTQQSVGNCIVTSDSQRVYKLFKKYSFFMQTHLRENIAIKEYCIARHDDKVCFPPNCRYHIIFIRDIKELLQKLNAFCFDYQHTDCLHTVFEYRSSGKSDVKKGQLYGIVDSSFQPPKD